MYRYSISNALWLYNICLSILFYWKAKLFWITKSELKCQGSCRLFNLNIKPYDDSFQTSYFFAHNNKFIEIYHLIFYQHWLKLPYFILILYLLSVKKHVLIGYWSLHPNCAVQPIFRLTIVSVEKFAYFVLNYYNHFIENELVNLQTI